MGDLLGEGGYGTVHIATRRLTKKNKNKQRSFGSKGATDGAAAADGREGGEGIMSMFNGARDDASGASGAKENGNDQEEASAIVPGMCVAIKKVSTPDLCEYDPFFFIFSPSWYHLVGQYATSLRKMLLGVRLTA